MQSFWEGFEKRASFTAAFKGITRKTRVPRTPAQVERVLDYGAMKAAPKPAANTLDYGAMKAQRSEAKAVREHDAAHLNYSTGKPVLEAKGAPVSTPAAQAAPKPPAIDAHAQKRIQNATKGSTPITHWHDALKEGVG